MKLAVVDAHDNIVLRWDTVALARQAITHEVVKQLAPKKGLLRRRDQDALETHVQHAVDQALRALLEDTRSH